MNRQMRWFSAIAGLIGVAAACSQSQSAKDFDGFDNGTRPLALLAAPAGLCLGDGTQKECSDPTSCTSRGTSEPSTFSVGFGGSSGGATYPSPSPTYGGAGGTAGGPIYTAGAGGTITSTGGAAPIVTADAGTEPPSCTDAADAASDAQCGSTSVASDAGSFAQSSQAIEVTACSVLDQTDPATLYLSADDSNSTASATIARRLIRTGGRVPATIVRPYEFLNYYNFSFEPAEPGEVRIVPQLSSCPVNGELSFQVALQSEERNPNDRRALNLTLVLDTSGSMSGEPIALERAAIRALAGRLSEGDVVSAVTWNVDQRDLLVGHAVIGSDDPAILAVADSLNANGGTDLDGGLQRGYELAGANWRSDRINRVILISDGQANVGQTNAALIGTKADDEEGGEGIYLAGVGVGDGVNDTLMDVVTDAGRGAYVYLDSEAEAEHMLGDHFLEVVDVAARGVRLELQLPWYLGVAKFYGEEISTDPTKVRPQHLAPNSAMLFFQILRACDPSLLNGDDRVRLRATWETPFTRQSREAVIDTTLNALAGDDGNLTKAAAVAGYAEALTRADLTTDPAAARAALDEALANVRNAKGASEDPDLLEIAALLDQYRQRF